MTGQSRPNWCTLCNSFTNDLLAFKFQQQETYPSDRWIKYDRTGDAFRHHDTLDALRNSAKSCPLCAVLAASFEKSGADGTNWLELLPFHKRREEHFIATFQGSSEGQRAYFSSLIDIPFNFFVFYHKRPYSIFDKTQVKDEPDVLEAKGYKPQEKFLRSSSRALGLDSNFDTERLMLDNCSKNHPDCVKLPTKLPTRVVDVGTSPSDAPRLYITKGEEEPYLALSHCWGGNIPHKLIEVNLEAFQQSLPQDLPQNFKDAIRVTRELGLRYIWIDAMCIIQDSVADWKREAEQMASIYSNSVLTISAIDSDRSTAGFLNNASTQVSVDEDFTIGPEIPASTEILEQNVLNGRGWCYQERLLSPTLLHYGRDQIMWECRTGLEPEKHGGYYGKECPSYTIRSDKKIDYAPQNFVKLRASFSGGPPTSLDQWYQIVGEFNGRDLTCDTDKFPAVAGAAKKFQAAGLGKTYIGGLWKEDLYTGLFWGPRTRRMPRCKAVGVHACVDLTRPSKLAPSWSWASVNGLLEFQNPNREVDAVFEVLEVNASSGVGDLTASHVDATLKLRALVAEVRYSPSTTWKGLGKVGYKTGNEQVFAIMDFDRFDERPCWALVTGEVNPKMLLLDKTDRGTFVRIGMGTPTNLGKTREHYEVQEILLE